MNNASKVAVSTVKQLTTGLPRALKMRTDIVSRSQTVFFFFLSFTWGREKKKGEATNFITPLLAPLTIITIKIKKTSSAHAVNI